ncbi:response regulator [bacterium]|nr:response regulator [bacterium]
MKRILIIDDQKEVLHVLKKVVTKLGYEGITADNWEDAEIFSESDPVDLIMLDIHMPGRSGFEIAKDIKTQKPEQKIVIMTGLDPATVHQKLEETEVDFNELLFKPFRIPEIQRILHKLLN